MPRWTLEDPASPGFIRDVVLVTGSRLWNHIDPVNPILGMINPDVVIHGGYAGADTLAAKWADRVGVEQEVFKVEDDWWQDYGRRIGPWRNRAMVDRLQHYRSLGHRVLVVGFPVGKSPGTYGCMELAKDANLPVLQYVYK